MAHGQRVVVAETMLAQAGELVKIAVVVKPKSCGGVRRRVDGWIVVRSDQGLGLENGERRVVCQTVCSLRWCSRRWVEPAVVCD